MADKDTGKSAQPDKAAPAKAEPGKAATRDVPEAVRKAPAPRESGSVADGTHALHAGGYVDRGDGDGWVIEEEDEA